MVFFVHNSPTAFLRPPKKNLTFWSGKHQNKEDSQCRALNVDGADIISRPV